MSAPMLQRQSGGQGRVRRAGRRQMSEINVTPFVDVMLVLLIIFMVAAPLLTVGVPIELPKTAATPLQSEIETPLEVSITSDGDLILQETPIADEELVPKLQAVVAQRADDRLYLRADGNIPYERVMQVMGALNAAGFTSIGLVTEGGGPTFDSAAPAPSLGGE